MMAGLKGPVREFLSGAPYQRSQRVRVAQIIDLNLMTEEEQEQVLSHVGQTGIVEYLEYSCGCGQSYPADPMIGVQLDGGSSDEFWAEELEAI